MWARAGGHPVFLAALHHTTSPFGPFVEIVAGEFRSRPGLRPRLRPASGVPGVDRLPDWRRGLAPPGPDAPPTGRPRTGLTLLRPQPTSERYWSRAVSTQNSFPSGSAITTQVTSSF